MKILLIHQAFVSPDEAGGTRHYELASYCKLEDIEFIIVASNVSYLTGKSLGEPHGLFFRQKIGVVEVLRARTLAVLHRSFIWRVISFFSFMITSVWAGLRSGPVDLIMGTSPPIFQAISAWLVSKIRKKPFLLEIRDLWPEFAIDMGVLKNPLLIKLSRWIERFLYSRANAFLVNSPAYRDYLNESHGIPLSKITLIPNGVDPSFFSPDDKGEAFLQDMGIKDKFVVTYAGAIGIANDIPTILRAAERLKDDKHIQILLVGDGKEKDNMEQLANKMLLENVTFTGARPKSSMPNILAASSACLATLQNIPMFRMTYPNKVFDYMAAGRPTILGIDGVIRKVIDAAKGGVFVQPGNDRDLAMAIQHLRKNPSKVKKMGSAARHYVEINFDRSKQASDFQKLLKKLYYTKSSS